MIPAFGPELREDLSDAALNAIAVEVAGGVCCVICGTTLAAAAADDDEDGYVNVIALRPPRSTERMVRYAHVHCAPSQLIAVDVLPDEDDDVAALISTAAAPGAVEDQREELLWALSARVGPRLPTIILAVDLALVEELPVRGEVLLKTFRLEGFCGGRDLDTLTAPFVPRVTTSREGATLTIHTRHGEERLGLAGDARLRDALHLAAVQRQLLLVVGTGLDLGASALEEVERRMQFSGAVAAAVRHSDPELAGIPLWGNRRQRIGRQLAKITPSGRRRRRAARRS